MASDDDVDVDLSDNDDARGGGDADIGIAPPAKRAKPDGDASALEKTATTRRESFPALADKHSWIGRTQQCEDMYATKGNVYCTACKKSIAVAGKTGNLRIHAERPSLVFLLVSRARS